MIPSWYIWEMIKWEPLIILRQFSQRLCNCQATIWGDLKVRATNWEFVSNQSLLCSLEEATSIKVIPPIGSTWKVKEWPIARAKQQIETPLESLKNTPTK